MKKIAIGLGLVVASVGVGGTAFAGEVGGGGKPTPIAQYRAGSICSFSGLDDGSEGGAGGPGEAPQNWGQIAKSFATQGGVREFAQAGVLHDEGPGTNCRGYASTGG